MTKLWLHFLILLEVSPAYRYIFSTEGHLLPATPQISLVREHCSYYGAYCEGLEVRPESHASAIPSDRQDANDSRLYRIEGRPRFQSASTFLDSASVSGLIKVRIIISGLNTLLLF